MYHHGWEQTYQHIWMPTGVWELSILLTAIVFWLFLCLFFLLFDCFMVHWLMCRNDALHVIKLKGLPGKH